jgi:tetratricopeptide (TPR) repeat protein
VAVPGDLPAKEPSDEEAVRLLFSMEDFRRPAYLADWVQDALGKHLSGIFHLELEEGMGKSTFARALDPTRRIEKAGVDLEDTAVRGYYVDSSAHASLAAYCNTLPGIFNRDEDGSRIFEEGEVCLQYLRPECGDTVRELIDLLYFYRGAFKPYYGTSRLLLVLDGLEAIPERQLGSLLDSVPRPEQLMSGSYILLITRLVEDLPPKLRGAEALLNVTEHFRADRGHDGYRATLREYAQETLARAARPARGVDMETLLEIAEWRFLYLRPLLSFFSSSGGAPAPENLSGGRELLELRLEDLRALRGEEFHVEATQVTAILASAYEPLTLKELAFLSGRGGADSRLLAVLVELRAFLRTERGDRGHLVSLHAEWKAAAKRILGKTIGSLVEGWIERFGSAPHAGADAESDGLSYLLSHLTAYCAEYDFADPLGGMAVAALLRSAADGSRGRTGVLHAAERRFLMIDAAVKIYEKAREEGGDVENVLASAYRERGRVHLDRKEERSALDDCNRALDIRLKLEEEGRLPDRDGLAEVYLARGNVFVEMWKTQFAAADFDMAVEIREALDAEGRLPDRSLLAAAYLDRGKFLQSKSTNKSALKDYSRALELLEALDADGLLRDGGRLARAYLDRARSYALGDDEPAIADYDRALAIAERLEAEGGRPDRDLLASVLLSRGYVLMRMHRMREAVADFDSHAGFVARSLLRCDAANGMEPDSKDANRGTNPAYNPYLAEPTYPAACCGVVDSFTPAGMGESLANYENSMGALEEFRTLNPSASVSLSTVDLADKIRRLVVEQRAKRLFVSLRAADDAAVWPARLEARGVPVRVRPSSGRELNVGCGQLAAEAGI